MKNIVCLIIIILTILPSRIKSQDKGLDIRKEVKEVAATPDSLYLKAAPTVLISQEEKVPGLLKVSKGESKIDSKFIESKITPESSYFNNLEYLESNEKSQSMLKSTSAISSAVGEIAMSTDVSPSGSTTVNVPIELSKGVGNLMPSVSLIYNNQSGNGVAGAGWNIGGMPSASIRNKSIYYDGKTSPGSLPMDLCWEGKRLIFKVFTGTFHFYELEGSDGAITADYSSSGTLTVRDNQGNKYAYVYSSNNAAFRLTKITDRFGNYIDYSYKFSDNYYYIEKISYGGNQTKGTSHTQFVNFTYETRHDPMLSYHSGKEIKITLRLKTITTGSKVYSLDYLQSYFSLLSNLRCQLVNGMLTQNLEPLYFSYGGGIANSGSLNKKEGNLSSYFTDGRYETIEATTGRFSAYDKEEGFAVYPKKNTYQWGEFKGDGYQTLHSMYSPEDVVLISPTYSDATSFFGTYQVKVNNGFRGVVTLNADNLPENSEVVLINATGGNTNFTQNISFRVFSYAGLAQYGVTKTINFTLPAHYRYNNYTSVTPIQYQTGNFKGDGIERVLGIQQKAGDICPTSALYLFDLKTQTQYRYVTPFTMDGEDKIITLDYDGDGKSDLYHFHGSGFDIYSFEPVNPESSTDLSFSLRKIASSTAITRGHFNEEDKERKGNIFSAHWYARRNILFGDINGDGKIDIIKTAQYGSKDGTLRSMNGDTWVQVLSAGNGVFNVTSYDMPGVWLNTYNDVFMHDFNGDGYSDVVCMKNNVLQVIHSNGFQIKKELINNYTVDGYEHSGKLFTIGINYSNHNRIVGYIKGQKVAKLSIDRNEIAKSYLTSTLTSHNVKTNIIYSRIDDDNQYCYSSGYGAQFPFENYNGYFWVVSNLNKTFIGNKFLDLNYSYSNAVIHKQGLGFCGFENVSSYDGITGRSTEFTYDPFHLGVVKQINAYDQKIENTYDFSYVGNKEPKFRLTNQKSTNYITGIITTVDNAYDTYGNVIKSIEQYGSDVTKEITSDYYNYKGGTSGTSIIGFPLNVTSKITRGSNIATSSSHFTYNDKYLPESVIKKINGKIVSQSLLSYDIFSNLIKEENTPYEASDKTLTVSYTYSDDGYNLLRYTNELGKATEYSYSGNLLTSAKDFKGNIVRYEYDAARRVVKQTNPDNTFEQTSYAYDDYNHYTVTKTATGSPDKNVQYDGLHRIVKEETQSLNSIVYNYTEYDSRGRVSRTSLPSFSPSPSYWNTYSYDNYDRISSLNYASGKKDSYSYNKNNITSVIDGVSSTKTFDATGQVIKVSDAAGTITYNLRADGQPVSIIAPGNVTTSFTYDEYGRKKSITDPSAGKQSYTYDAVGNINSETDGTNKTTTYTYDNYSRLTQKIRSEFTTTYTYNTNDGLLTLESSGNGTSTSYAYDNYGRLSEIKEMVPDGKFLQKTYSYANGNVSYINYATQDGGISGEAYSYTNGILNEIKLNGTNSIWRLNSLNAFGQPTEVTTSGFNRTYGYNAFGLPTSRGAGSFQNFTYIFDSSNGNLSYRKDNRYGMQEDFTYDNLNRLTEYDGRTASYDIKGNITQKSDVGSFSYNTYGKPYNISSVDLLSTTIPLREQYITYTSFKRPASVTENNYVASFVYNGNESRVKMELKKNGAKELTRYYISDCYEIDDRAFGGTKEKLYLGGDFYSAPAVYVKDGSGSWQLYFICRDYLGSITHIANSSGSLVQELSYDAWGRLRNPSNQQVYEPGSEPAPFLGRGYTGHEHLTMFGLINMNARLYDPAVGRFLAADPYVQAPDFSQNFNRYSYCLNNPLRYTDPNGEFIFSLFLGPVGVVLDGMCWGAVIGAGTSAVAYTIGAGISGNWSSGNFWNAVGMGAVGGALGGGFGALGSVGVLGSFGNTLGYSMLNQAASSALTNTMFGNDMTWGSVAGMAAGSVLGSVLPGFKPIDANPTFKNAIAEIGFNSGKGALTGFTSGLVQAGIDKNPNAIWQNTLGGTVSGASSTLMNLAFFGPAYKPHDTYYSHDRNGQTTYRKGGLLLRDGAGLTWGRTLGVSGEGDVLVGTEAHESTHMWQQNKMGWANFYGKTITQYTRALFSGSILNLYNNWLSGYSTRGTLEWQAERASEYYMKHIY